MLRYSVGLFTLLILYSTLTLDAPSKEEIQPKIRKHSQMLYEGDKRYVSDIEYWPKRYVGDVKNKEIGFRRRRGVEKKYVGRESEQDFFEYEEKALYKYISLQREVEPLIDEGKKMAVIIEEDNVLSNIFDTKMNMEKKEKIEIEKTKRKIQETERKIEKKDRKTLGNERKIIFNERKIVGNKRKTVGGERKIYGTKREKIDIPTVVIGK